MVKKHQSNIWLLIVGLIMAFLGVYVLFNPVTALMALALYLGIAFIAMGIGYIAFYRYAKSHLLLAIAIVDIIIGLLFVLNLSVTATTLPIIFAMWVLFVGILQIVTAFEYRDMGDFDMGMDINRRPYRHHFRVHDFILPGCRRLDDYGLYGRGTCVVRRL